MSPATHRRRKRPHPEPGRASVWFVALGGLWVALGFFGLLGPLSDATFVVVAGATLVASQAGILRHRPSPRWPWMLLTSSLVVFIIGGAVRQVVGSYGDLTPQRSVLPDYFVLCGYLFGIAAFVGFLRLRWRRRGHDLDAVLDSAVVALAALTVAWVYLMTPALLANDLTVKVRLSLAVYPPMSAFQAAVALRLAFASGERRSVAQRLLVSMVFWLVAGDVLATLGDAHLLDVPERVTDLPYAVAFLMVGAIFLHPSMREFTDEIHADEARSMRSRLVMIVVAVAIPAVVIQFYGNASLEERRVLGAIVLALGAVTATRVARALHQHARAEARLRYQATHDELTGLPNRSRVLALIGRALRRRDRNAALAVLFVDVDRFKLVNDTSGHAVGDELLLAIARRLTAAAGPGQLAARLGGDEFLVVLDGVDGLPAVLEVAEDIRRAMEVPFDIRGLEVFSSASIGAVLVPPGSTDRNPESIVQDADTAMYQVKTSGGGGVAVFDNAMRDRRTERLLLERDLHKALDRRELRLYYQPIVALATGAVDGFEALIRWNHPTRGLVPPSTFIPIAEETGLIVPIGEWVLQEAARQLAEWRPVVPGVAGMCMAVNVSARQLRDPRLVGRVAQVLMGNDLPPQALCVELTESILTEDPDAAAAVLADIRALGVRLSLDDFGTGYSSLAYLKRFAVDNVKIDKAFVDDLGAGGSEEEPLVAAIIAMAGALHLTTVAEGVEEPGQAQKLVELGATRAQGYLFSRPLPADVVPAALERMAARRAATERGVTPELAPSEA